ncbi:MAG: M64 family metallopeptidase [Planctomycetota bacterium]
MAALGTSYDALGIERYALTLDNRALREAAALAPYDHLEILMNDRKYGGGGIFNLYATCAAHSSSAPYLFVHEFGHCFAGLADEYYTSPVAYEEGVSPGQEPWEPNVTALSDPAALKWRALVTPTPLPTPWHKQEFDDWSARLHRRAPGDACPRRHRGGDGGVPGAWPGREQGDARQRGARRCGGRVEGAAYQARGLYRPSVDCVMFTRNLDIGFCPVCARAIEGVIDLYAQ